MKLLILLIVMISAQSFATEIKFSKTKPPMIFWDVKDWTDIIKSSLEETPQIIDYSIIVPGFKLMHTAYRTA